MQGKGPAGGDNGPHPCPLSHGERGYETNEVGLKPDLRAGNEVLMVKGPVLDPPLQAPSPLAPPPQGQGSTVCLASQDIKDIF